MAGNKLRVAMLAGGVSVEPGVRTWGQILICECGVMSGRVSAGSNLDL